MTDTMTMTRARTGAVSMEERLRWPSMTKKELEEAIRRDPETGEIDWTQFELPELTQEEMDQIQREEEELIGDGSHLEEIEYADEELIASVDIDMAYRLRSFNAKREKRYGEAEQLRRKSRLNYEAIDIAKRAFGIENTLEMFNVVKAVREYGVNWLRKQT